MTLLIRIWLLLFFYVAIFFNTAEAATYRVPQDFETIQSALGQGVSGDVVVVDEGNYVEDIQINGGFSLIGVNKKMHYFRICLD